MKQRGIFEKVRGSGEWWVRYVDAAGRYRREKIGAKKAAIALYRKRKNEALEGRKLPEKFRRAPATFGQIAEDALVYSRKNKRSYRADVSRMARLKVLFGDHAVEDLMPKEIEEVLDRAADEERWAPSTFNHYRSLVSLAYRLAIRDGKATVNPARSVRHRREDNSRVRFLALEEESRLREIIRSKYLWHLPEFEIALHTGLRQGSQYALTWDMVDWQGRMLHVPRTKNEDPLHLPLNDVALVALNVVRSRGNESGRVFLSERTGEALEHPRHWFETAIRESKIADFHWHDLRHTFASRLRMQGVPLETIADLLGHKGLTMTKRYAHLGPSQLHEAVARLTMDLTDTRTDTSASGSSVASSQHYVN